MSVQHDEHVPETETEGAANISRCGRNPAQASQLQPMEIDSEPLPGPSTVHNTSAVYTEERTKFSPIALRLLDVLWGFESLTGLPARIDDLPVVPSLPLAPDPTGPPMLATARMILPLPSRQGTDEDEEGVRKSRCLVKSD